MKNDYDDSVRSELMEKFRVELPVFRAKAKVSQESLADKIGISRQTYSGIETGKREMTWTIFLALWTYFQNNDDTRDMVNLMYDFGSDVSMVMNSK